MQELPDTPFSRRIDHLVGVIGTGLSYIWLLLLGVIVVNVMLRYAFDRGFIELEEIQWHLYSVGFLFGLSYAYQADTHIRVDVLYESFSPRLKGWIELYGIVLFLLPFVFLILIFGVPFVISSYQVSEISASPGGLPLRWLIKAALPLAFAMLLLAVLSRLIRVWNLLFLLDEDVLLAANPHPKAGGDGKAGPAANPLKATLENPAEDVRGNHAS
ncbi:MAG TPA: C4-dicarboxylate ABC transporter permease [Gammaproteobacteria bacterium]|nr:C4-dicarboxylate ABC transporter permease [Gammaproteobacteria bacterium]|tara:strand:- start:403 stop:1047 length:645 start_codon:yes stop_codon:yes gene_type:complete